MQCSFVEKNVGQLSFALSAYLCLFISIHSCDVALGRVAVLKRETTIPKLANHHAVLAYTEMLRIGYNTLHGFLVSLRYDKVRR